MDTLTLDTRHGRMAITRSGRGTPVVLLHGVPGSAAAWARVVPLLAESAEVFVPDLLGFGGSDRPTDLATLHAQGQAEALDDALEALGLDAVTMIGHDFGGPVALALTELRPGRVPALGLVSTNAFPDTPIPFPLSLLGVPVVGRALGPVLFSRPSLAAMLGIGTGRPHVRLDRSAYLGDAGQVRTIRTVFEGSLRRLDDLFRPTQRQLESWSGPTVVVWGDRDPFFPVAQGERTAATAGTTLTLLPGAGHFLPDERPAEVAAAIVALLSAADRADR